MKTLIWDFNGTILDDLELCLEAEKEMLRRRGMFSDYSKEDYRNMFCFPVINYYYKLGYTFQEETYDEISVEFNDLYDKGFSTCTLMDGFADKIREAIGKDMRNVILSASRQQALLDQCHFLHIAHYFDEILGMDNSLAHSKIEMAKNWMEASSVKPEDCIYIGDTVHDAETAQALGIENCWLVACGHQSYEVLKTTDANVVRTLREVKL